MSTHYSTHSHGAGSNSLRIALDNSAANDVPLLRWLYTLSYPLASLLMMLRFTPNAITLISTILGLSAAVSLWQLSNPWIFAGLWFAALIFDLCDGIVARVKGLSTPNGAFHDSFSDQIKLVIVLLAGALKYNTVEIWTMAFVANSMWLLVGYLNKSRAIISQNYNQELEKRGASVPKPKQGSERWISWPKPFGAVAWFLYSMIFLVHGNVNLWLLGLGSGITAAKLSYSLFVLITMKSCLGSIIAITRTNRKLAVLD